MAAEVKGVLLNAQMLFMKTYWDEAQIEQAMATLQPDDAKLLGQRFLDAGWYPQQTEVAMRRLIRAMPPRPGNIPLEVGSFIAEHAFTRVYSSLLTRDVGRMVTNIPFVANLVYRNLSDIEARRVGERACALTYRYPVERPTRAVCQSIVGFWSKVLQLSTGSANVSGSHIGCICDGAAQCEFAFAW